MSIKSTLLALLFLSGMLLPASAQFCPVNIDFETGTTSNWEYFKGTVAIGPVYSMTPCPPPVKRHTLTSGVDTDYYGGFPVVAPGGKYSMKIGNNAAGGECERIRYYVHVPIGGVYSLIYQYAAVMQDVGHSPAEQPRMTVRAFDSSTGVTIPCDSLCFVASKGLYDFKRSPYSTRGDTIRYRPWTSASMNFQGLGGHVICIEFTVNDCTALGHFGYGYVDMNCGLFASKILSCATPTVKLNGTPGYQNYRWCDSLTMGITIDTTQDITIPAPKTRKTYALILNPFPGYGCQDTLYTEVLIQIPCSGTPAPGHAYITRSPFCGKPDELNVSGYSLLCGLSYQWQSSTDNILWSDMPGATTERYELYHPYTTLYYRCVVTCIATGSVSVSSPVLVPKSPGPVLHTIVSPHDTVCLGANFYVSTCGASTMFNVTTYYGDGTSDNRYLTKVGLRHADFRHSYFAPGIYSIKQILYDDTVVVDSGKYSFGYNYCSVLPIKYYIDDNHDCIYNSTESGLRVPVKTEVDSNGFPIDTIVATSGFYYQANGGPGTVYSFKMLPLSAMVASCPSSGVVYDTIVPFVNNYPVRFFGVNCVSGVFDLGVNSSIVSGTNVQVGRILSNTIACAPVSSSLNVHLSDRYTYVPGSAYPEPTSATDDLIKWDFSSSFSDKFFYRIKPNPLLPPILKGDIIVTSISISPTVGDADTSNNQQTIQDTVRGPYDPNIIQVFPDGCLPTGVPANNLKYTIHFENLGNDTAHNVHIMDTLSEYVDPKTIEVLGASAQMNIAVLRSDGYSIVKFDFSGINLPDSSHVGENSGMVMYNIKTRPGLTKGTSIQNHAGIFFDYNDVVLTNTVENIIGCPTLKVTEVGRGVAAQIYPNPATDALTIKMTKNAYTSYTITNQVGQVLVQQQISATQTQVNIKTLAPGLYYITLRGENGTSVQKFVKL